VVVVGLGLYILSRYLLIRDSMKWGAKLFRVRVEVMCDHSLCKVRYVELWVNALRIRVEAALILYFKSLKL
jgi:hypothetical protein